MRIATIGILAAALAISLLMGSEALAQSAEPPNAGDPPPTVETAAPGEDGNRASDPKADAPPDFRPTETVPPGSSVSFPVDI